MKEKIYGERFEIRFPKALLDSGDTLAKKRHLTLSQLIRDLLVRELKNDRK